VSYGIEVKNMLRYLDLDEFVTKVRLRLHLGLKPIFAVRALPRTWIDALYHAGGYAMIMQYQTHADLAQEIRGKLGLPVDTPKRIEAGTMQRFEKWVEQPRAGTPSTERVERLLRRFEAGRTSPDASDSM
jgi:hypothetical protein